MSSFQLLPRRKATTTWAFAMPPSACTSVGWADSLVWAGATSVRRSRKFSLKHHSRAHLQSALSFGIPSLSLPPPNGLLLFCLLVIVSIFRLWRSSFECFELQLLAVVSLSCLTGVPASCLLLGKGGHHYTNTTTCDKCAQRLLW